MDKRDKSGTPPPPAPETAVSSVDESRKKVWKAPQLRKSLIADVTAAGAGAIVDGAGSSWTVSPHIADLLRCRCPVSAYRQHRQHRQHAVLPASSVITSLADPFPLF